MKLRPTLVTVIVVLSVTLIVATALAYWNTRVDDRLEARRVREQHAALVFLCEQVNDLDTAVTEIVRGVDPIPPVSPRWERALALLDEVYCDPHPFNGGPP